MRLRSSRPPPRRGVDTRPATRWIGTRVLNTVNGSQATETDSGVAGAPAVVWQGQQATETDTGVAGTAIVVKTGAQATETDTGVAGVLAVAKPGTQAETEDGLNVIASHNFESGSSESYHDSADNASMTWSLETGAGNVYRGSRSRKVQLASPPGSGTFFSAGDDVAVGAGLWVRSVAWVKPSNGTMALTIRLGGVGSATYRVSYTGLSSSRFSLIASKPRLGDGVQAFSYSISGDLTDSDVAYYDRVEVVYAGVPIVVVQGSQATETDTGQHGTPAVAKPGSQALTRDGLNTIDTWPSDTTGSYVAVILTAGGGSTTDSIDTTVPYRGDADTKVDWISGASPTTELGSFNASDVQNTASPTNGTWVRAQGFARSGGVAGSFQLSLWPQNGSWSSDIPLTRGGGTIPAGSYGQGDSEPLFFTTAAYGTGVGLKILAGMTSTKTPFYFDEFSVYYCGVLAEVLPGTLAPETDTGQPGTANVVVVGHQATETDTGVAGAPAVVIPGAQASETDTGEATPHDTVVSGAQATETDTGIAGAIAVALPGALATETDTASSGTAIVVVVGALATETDTGVAGAPAVVIPGAQASETDTGVAGAAIVVKAGAQASETDTGVAGAARVIVIGTQAVEIDEPVGRLVTATNIETTGDNVDRDSYTTGAFTPVANRLYLLSVFGTAPGAPPTPTITTTTGLAFQLVRSVQSSGQRLSVYRAMKPSGLSNGTITIDWGVGAAMTHTLWSIVELANAVATGTDGANAVRQSAVENNDTPAAGGTTSRVDLAAFGALTNATFGAFKLNSLNTAFTAGSGFTIVGQAGHTAPTRSLATEFRSDNDTSVDVTWTGSSAHVGIALEIVAITGGVPLVVLPGTQTSESDTAQAGAAIVVKAGAQASETDTGVAGTAAVVKAGAQATETDTGIAGAPAVVKPGAQASETDTGVHGTPVVAKPGALAAETDTTSSGAAIVVVAGSQAEETDIGEDSHSVAVDGSQATETDTASTGTAIVSVAGHTATETDTGTAGAAMVVTTGAQGTETDTGRVGSFDVAGTGAQATETDTGIAGATPVVVAGTQALTTETGVPGLTTIRLPGGQVTVVETVSAGEIFVRTQGVTATEHDTGIAGTNTGGVLVGARFGIELHRYTFGIEADSRTFGIEADPIHGTAELEAPSYSTELASRGGSIELI